MEDRQLLDASAPLAAGLSTMPVDSAKVPVETSHWIVRVDGLSGSKTAQAKSAQELIVKGLGKGTSVEVLRQLGQDGVFSLAAPKDADRAALRQSLASIPGFRYLEPDATLQLMATPNDPSYPNLWGMNNTGQTGGTTDADIDAPEAWDISTGSSSIVVGVIDSGVDYTHPDLVDNIWVNPGEIAGNGVDDDANGYVDDVNGWDFIDNDSDPMDQNGHGTHVSGTIGAVGNNGLGVVGVNWDVSIMALRVADAWGYISLSGAVEATNYAAMMHRDHGVNVKVTNNSWGGPGYWQALYDAIQNEQTEGILFAAAAGNSGSDNDVSPNYPSNYDLDNIVAVAATDSNDALAGFSCYGATSVDLAAPGVDTLSTVPGGGYASMGGTSMATPHVSGVAALAWSVDPNASYQRVRDALLTGADPSSSLVGMVATGARLNALGALTHVGLAVESCVPGHGDVLTTLPTSFAVTFSDAVDPATVQASDLVIDGAYPAQSMSISADNLTATFSFAASPVSSQGSHTVALAGGSIERLSDHFGLFSYATTYRYDATRMTVVAAAPANGSTVTLPMTTVQLDLNEPVDPASVGLDDVQATQGAVVAAEVVAGSSNRSLRYTLSGVVAEGTLGVIVPAGQWADVYGNPNLPYAGSYTLDYATTAFPAVLQMKEPKGSMIYEGAVAAFIAQAGDADTYQIALDAFQQLTVTVAPDAALQARVEVYSPEGVPLKVGESAAGEDVVLQMIEVSSPGLYSVVVFGGTLTPGTTGAYVLDLALNAAVEAEMHGGAADDSPAAPQNLGDYFLDLGGGASMASVLGRGDGEVPDSVGPNAFGYEALPVSPQFIDISTTGMVLTDSAYNAVIPLSAADLGGFTFNFYGTTYSEVNVSTEGVLSFDWGVWDPANSDLQVTPDVATIAPFWDDLFVDYLVTGGMILYEVQGTGDDQRLIVQWQNVSNELAWSGTITFQAVLSERDGTIQFNYANLAGMDYGSEGSTATAGIKNATSAGSDPLLILQDNGPNQFVGSYQSVLIGVGIVPPLKHDYYAIHLNAGDSVTLAVAADAPGLRLELCDASLPDPALMAVSNADANLDAAIHRFVAPSGGDYLARVTGPEADYQLVVTVNADFDAERNSAVASAQPLTPANVAVGYVRGEPVAGKGGVSIPASDGNFPRSSLPPSFEPAPVVSDRIASHGVKFDGESKGSGGAKSAPMAFGAAYVMTDFWARVNLQSADVVENLGTLPTFIPGGDFDGSGDFSFAYAIDAYGNNLIRIDTATGAVTTIGPMIAAGESWTAMANDPTDRTMYVAGYNGSISTLYTVDLASGAVTRIGEITGAPLIIGLAIDDQGRIYGEDIAYDNLVLIDKATGAGTVVGSLGFDASYSQGMDFDDESGILYMAAFNVATLQGELRVVDTTTGATAVVDQIGRTSPRTVVEMSWLAVAATVQDDDFYHIQINPDDFVTIITSVPAAGPDGAAADLVPAVELYDPTGALVAGDIGGTTIYFAGADDGGVYSIRVYARNGTRGEYRLSVTGATGSPEAFHATGTDLDGVRLRQSPNTITVSFDDQIFVSSIVAGDLQVITGDGSTVSATGFEAVDGRTLVFTLPATLVEGDQQVLISAGSLSDLQSTPVEEFRSEFFLDLTPPRVTATSIAEGEALPSGADLTRDVACTITFSEPMLAANLDANDVRLASATTGRNFTPASLGFDASGTVLSLQYMGLPDDAYTLLLIGAYGRFEDLSGWDLDGEANASLPSGDGIEGGNFTLNFAVDLASAAYPLPLIALKPLGGLVYDPQTQGAIHDAADTDAYTLSVEAGQAIAVVARPRGTFLPTVRLRGPGGTVVASATAVQIGDASVIQAYQVGAAAGLYSVELADGGLGDLPGGYSVEVYLNAALESEEFGGATDDSPATPQDLTAQTLDLGGQTARAAVLGKTDDGNSDAAGPNGFGYEALPVRFEFTDISGTGTAILAGADDSFQELTAADLNGFTFDFYGAAYSNLFISSNGLISFGEGNLDYINSNLTSAPTTATIAVLWDDLEIAYGTNSAVFWQVLGAGADQQLVIQWNDVDFRLGAEPDQITFQAVLSERDGTIRLNYLDLASEMPGSEGAWAAVGIKNSNDAGGDPLVLAYQSWPNRFVGSGVSTLIGVGVVPPPPSDWYRFHLDAGQTATLALSGSRPDLRLRLFDATLPDPVLLAEGRHANNLTQGIHNFLAPTAGDYLANVDGAKADYQLIVTLGADFDAEPNYDFAHAQSISAAGDVLGYAAGEASSAAGSEPIGILSHFAGPAFTGYIPPDPTVAAGPNTIVAIVNTDLAIYDKSGTELFRQTMDGPGNFFGDVGATGTVFDPWVLFDQGSQRFFALGVDIASSTESNIYLAVSKTDSPVSGSDWWKYKLDFTDSGSGGLGTEAHFPDYPKMGVNDDAVWISGNYFPISSGSGVYAGITAIEKASLLGGTAARVAYREYFNGFSVFPMTQYGSSPVQYFAESNTGGDTAITIHAVSNVLTAPTRDTYSLTVPQYFAPVNAPQLGGGTAADAIDARTMSGVWRDGSMWFAHAAVDPILVDGETVARWYQVRTNDFPSGGTPELIQSGNVDPGPGVYAWMPAISVDARGNMAIAFSLGGGGQYFGCGFTGRLATDPAGQTILPVTTLAEGLGPYQLTDYFGRNRWGDYSGLALDPNDNATFWAFNEYATADGRWGTEIGSFQVVPPADDDWFSIDVAAGSHIQVTTSTPGAGAGLPDNPLDPRIELYAPDETLVAQDDNSAADKRNASLRYTAAVNGAYRVRVAGVATAGEYVLHVAGGSVINVGPSVVDADPDSGQRLGVFPLTYTLDFSEQLLISSAQPGDLTVGGLPCLAVNAVDGDTLVFTIDPAAQSPWPQQDGVYQVVLAAGAVKDLQGGDNLPFNGNFVLDTTGPRIVSTLWNGLPLGADRVIAAGPLTFTAVFDEPLFVAASPRRGPYTPGTDDVVLMDFWGTWWSPVAVSYDLATYTFTATFGSYLPEGAYELRLVSGSGAFEDMSGNMLDGESWGASPDGTITGDGIAGGDYVLSVSVDIAGSRPVSPFSRLAPLGALIAESASHGFISNAADADDWTLSAIAGELLTIEVYPSSLSFQLLDSGGGVIGTSTNAVLSVVGPATGDYTVRITSAAASSYGMYIDGNVLFEAVDTDDANPMPLDGSRVALSPTAERFAVLGYSEGGAADVYTLSLNGRVGRSLDIVLAGSYFADFSGSTLELVTPGGTTITGTAMPGGADPSNLDLGILDFLVPEDGTYTIRFTSDQWNNWYSLVAAVGAAFQTEPNETSADALRTLASGQAALGYLGDPLWVGSVDLQDTFRIDLPPQRYLLARTRTPLDDSHASLRNTLDPGLILYDANGVELARDLDGLDGKNALLGYWTDTGGTFLVQVVGEGGSGEYVLEQSVDTAYPLDVDQNNAVEPLKDGIVVLRYLFGFRGKSLVSGALGTGAQRTTAAAVQAYFESLGVDLLDIDGDGQTMGLTDGLLILRYMFGFRGRTLVNGVLGPNATRTTPDSVAAYLSRFVPPDGGKSAGAKSADASPAAVSPEQAPATLHDLALAAYTEDAGDLALRSKTHAPLSRRAYDTHRDAIETRRRR